MEILIFTEGTILRHPSNANSREELVAESKADLDIILDYANYVPIGAAVAKIKSWHAQGTEVYYLTSRRTVTEVNAIHKVLLNNGFPQVDNLLHRQIDETYAKVAERLMPTVLIEDDCESIGGIKEMTYTNISSEAKEKIKSIALAEFGGIDHLPDDLESLLKYATSR